MLTIRYNGRDIPTGEDFSVRFSWVNPACRLDGIPGDAGLGIEIPVSGHSRSVFGSPHRFEKHATGSEGRFPGVEIRFSGVLLMAGTLNITHATPESYSGWLQSQVGVMGQEQREKYVDELDWSAWQEVILDNKGSFDDAGDDYCTGEILNRAFWESIGRTVETQETYRDEQGLEQTRAVEVTELSLQHRDSFAHAVNKSFDNKAVTQGSGCVVSAFLFLRFVLNHILKLSGFWIDPERNAFDTVEGYRNLALYNNYNLMQPSLALTPAEVWETDLNTGEPVLVRYDRVTDIAWSLWGFSYARLLPRVKAGDFLLGIQNLLNFVFVFGGNHRVSVIDRNAIPEGPATDLDRYFREEWIIGERRDVTLKFTPQHDPEDSTIGDRYHDLTDRRGDMGADVATLEALRAIASPAYGEIRHVLSTDEYYEYRWDTAAEVDGNDRMSEFDHVGWVLASTGPQPLLYGTGTETEEVSTCISSPYMAAGDAVVVMQQGAIGPMRTLWNNFTPRLMFHYGNNQVLCRNVIHGTSLRWGGPEGLFEKRWRRWAEFWCRRLPVEGRFDLPLNVLHHVISNITKKYATSRGEFIIQEVECEFRSAMMGRTTIKGYKV